MFYGILPWNMEYSRRLTTDAGMKTSIMIQYLCHCRRYSPHAILRFVFSEAWVRSNFPIVCGCFVVAHLSVMPKICVISAIIVDLNAVPLSVMSVVGKYACLVIMSMSAFATLIADASVRG